MELDDLTEDEKKAIKVFGRCGSAILSGFILNTEMGLHKDLGQNSHFGNYVFVKLDKNHL